MRVRAAMWLAALGTSVGLLASAAPALGQTMNTSCKMTFSLSGWSAFYKTASGEGVVKCSDGESTRVHIQAKGGGLTFGKQAISGVGTFSNVNRMHDVFGSYGSAGAHAGAVKSGGAQALTKGPVSLALSGSGAGWDVGIDFGSFKITPIK